jgi:hypothetical protein
MLTQLPMQLCRWRLEGDLNYAKAQQYSFGVGVRDSADLFLQQLRRVGFEKIDI